jgi:hypothetical protein
MKILFYLPVITPWWFTELVAPIIRAAHAEAEVHVMIAPRWRNTGVEPEHLAPLADLEHIRWHIIDEEDPEPFRVDGASVPGLMDLVHEIAPDITLARSPDTRTLARFPGTVRYIMEGAPPPFEILPLRILIEEQPFRLGMMPADAGPVADRCTAAFADVWADSDRFRHPPLEKSWRTSFGLPQERPILAVPLHYEHEENFFLMHSDFPRAVDLVRALLRMVDQDVFLAITDHPLNRRYVDRSALNQLVRNNSERAALCQLDGVASSFSPGASGVLAVRADAMLVDLSKSWALAAHAGTPIVRVGRASTADWLNATGLADQRLRKFTPGRLPAPDAEAARRYFCWHLGARVFDPYQLTLERLLAHVSGQVGDDIIESNARIMRERYRKAA